MILVCGGLADAVTELVCARLLDCGYAFRLLDMAFYPAGYQVCWHWRGAYPDGYIASSDWRLDLDELSGVYARYLGAEGRQPPTSVNREQALSIYAEHDTALAALLEYLPCEVINRLGGGMSNHSKTYQALLVRQCGLLTPPTLVTSDPEDARRFYDKHDGQIIYKSLSAVRSIVRRMSVEHLGRLPMVRYSPAQFQAFIPGDNIRVHTVGDRCFATRIRSEAVDYRYGRRDGHTVEMEPTSLPPAVVESCLRLARRLDLSLAGIDLKKTPDGRYYCFEVNPSPGFLYYEQATGQPISTAIADQLHLSTSRERRERSSMLKVQA